MRRKISTFLIMLGIVGIVLTIRGAVASGRPTVNLSDLDADFDKVGYFDIVEADVTFLLDNFAMEVTRTRFGIKTNEKFLYILPVMDNQQEEIYYIGMMVSRNEREQCDRIMDLTYKYFFEESGSIRTYSIHTSGFADKMNKRYYKLYREWFEETNWFESEEELEKYALPILFDVTAYPAVSGKFLPWSISILVTGVLLILWDVLPAKVQSRKDTVSRKKTGKPYITLNGIDYPREKLERVNLCVKHGAKDFAIDELVNVTGMSAAEAEEILKQWRKYYRD